MSRKTLDDITPMDGKELNDYLHGSPQIKKIHQSGSHVVWQGPNGSGVYCNREMGKGLWCKVIKSLKRAGVIAIGGGLVWLILHAPAVFAMGKEIVLAKEMLLK